MIVKILVIIFSQFLGLFPISGLSSRDPKKIQFTWLSIRTLFSICFVFVSIFTAFLNLYRQIESGPLTPSNIIGFIFYGNCAMICVFFFKFSTNFNEVISQWTKVEKTLRKSNIMENLSSNIWSLKKRVYFCACVSIPFGFLEHFMSLASHTERLVKEIDGCNWTKRSFMEFFIVKHLFFVFSGFQYNHLFGLLSEYINFTLTFYWSFLDAFIMIVSIGIAFHYDMVNYRIKLLRAKIVPDSVWFDIRLHYNEVSGLLELVNRIMNKMIVLACCNDAYFVIIQLLNLAS